MSVTLTEDLIDLTLEGVEFVPFRLDGPPAPCHPLPQLRRRSGAQPRSFRSVVMESRLLRITLIPDLGGRIIRWEDKRTGRDLLPWPPKLELMEGSHRGLWLKDGIRFILGDPRAAARDLDLGPVEYQLCEPQDEGQAGMVLLYELVPGGAATWQGGVTLYPDRAEVLIEFSLLNRSKKPISLDTGLALGVKGSLWQTETGAFGWKGSHGEGLWLKGDPSQGTAHLGPQELLVRPRAEESPLLPREVFAWSVRMAPFTGLGDVQDVSRSAGLGSKDGFLVLQSSDRAEKATLNLRTEAGSFAAESSLVPEKPFSAELSALPKIISLSLPDGTALNWGASCQVADDLGRQSQSSARQAKWSDESDESRFVQDWITGAPEPAFPSNPALTPAWRLARAESFCRSQDWSDAEREVDQSLILNGEDSLAWWLKAVIRRKLGAAERPELLNAHYLSPLEPLLRAESFLQQGGADTKEGSPVTLRLAKNPDLGLECIDHILNIGLAQEAAMLMDELLRHEEIGLIRLMLAWSLMTLSRMEAEAAQHLALFERNALQPPLPSRPREVQAVKELHARFPKLERLGEMAALAHPRSIG